MSEALYHYTCEHWAMMIGPAGVLRPWYQPFLGIGLVWLTDMAEPDREALGLTSSMLMCDRTEHRYRVTSAADIEPWLLFPSHAADDEFLALFESPPRQPARWFVSRHDVAVVLDDIGHG